MATKKTTRKSTRKATRKKATSRKKDDVADLASLHEAHRKVLDQLSSVVVGQEEVLEQLMISIFSRGHCLLEGVPGLAKTLMVSSLARCLSLDFKRIQFTPDLMPSDITGTEVLHEDKASGERSFSFVQGPLFANIVLGDEINRAPPKTQAALLEGMQERQVSAGGHLHRLPDPFFVLATMNPIEQEGTYSLPEAQLDRFMMKALVLYPSVEEERKVYRLTGNFEEVKLEKVFSGARIKELQKLVARIPFNDLCLDYAMALIRATRPDDESSPDFIRNWVSWGAGPRAGQALIHAAKGRAGLYGSPEVRIEDLKAMARPVLRHRLMLNYAAEAENQTPDSVISRLLDEIPVNPAEGAVHERVEKVLKA